MGRILTIRLHAVTYDEEDVFRAWPSLCALAWPGKGEATEKGGWRPKAVSFAPPVAPEAFRFGVVELCRDLLEEYRFADWDDDVKQRAKDGVAALENAVARLETALADWQPQAANAATDGIEDVLGDLERILAKNT